MKIAMTIVPASGRISPVFDASERIAVVECCQGRFSEACEFAFPVGNAAKIAFLEAQGIRRLICGAVSNEDILALKTRGIGACPFVSGDWREILGEWLRERRLGECHLMPGCRRHHRGAADERPSNMNQKKEV